jgi:hypothetical protein
LTPETVWDLATETSQERASESITGELPGQSEACNIQLMGRPTLVHKPHLWSSARQNLAIEPSSHERGTGARGDDREDTRARDCGLLAACSWEIDHICGLLAAHLTMIVTRRRSRGHRQQGGLTRPISAAFFFFSLSLRSDLTGNKK